MRFLFEAELEELYELQAIALASDVINQAAACRRAPRRAAAVDHSTRAFAHPARTLRHAGVAMRDRASGCTCRDAPYFPDTIVAKSESGVLAIEAEASKPKHVPS